MSGPASHRLWPLAPRLAGVSADVDDESGVAMIARYNAAAARVWLDGWDSLADAGRRAYAASVQRRLEWYQRGLVECSPGMWPREIAIVLERIAELDREARIYGEKGAARA